MSSGKFGRGSTPDSVNNTVAGDLVLRPTSDSGDLVLMTAGTERARIAFDGTVSGAFQGGAGGTSNPQAVIAPSNATSSEKAKADYVCDGTDDHVEIHQAMTDLGANGGKILLLPGNFNGGQVVMQNKIWVSGVGMRATNYKLKAGVNTDAWISFVSPDGIVTNAEFITISDLSIDANKSQQTAGNGIFLSNNSSGTKATNDIDFDPHNVVANVEILNAFQDGYAATNRSETRLYNVYSELSGRHGFNPSFDTFIDMCTAAHSGLSGFFFQSSSIRCTNSKAFYSGQVTPASGRGWWVRNIHGIVIAGCEAQDNNDAGFLLDGSSGCVIQGTADSNSTRGVGFAPAVDLFSATNNIVNVAALERKADGSNSFQQNAVRLRTTCTGNDIVMTNTAWSPATVGASLMSGSDATTGNRVFVNAVAV